jgi:hypothetical protein
MDGHGQCAQRSAMTSRKQIFGAGDTLHGPLR